MMLRLLLAALLLFPLTAYAQWAQMNGPEPPVVMGLAEAGGALVMATGESDHGAVFRSDGGGQAWSDAALRTESFAAHAAGGTFYVGTYVGGLSRSTDGGRSWAQVAGGLPTSSSIGAVAGTGDTLFATPFFEASGPLYRSTDGGDTWTGLGVGFQVATRALLVRGPVVLVGSERDGVRRSPDGGATWGVPAGIPATAHVGAFAVSDGVLYAGVWSTPPQSGLYRSADGGATWTRTASNLPGGAFESLVATGGALVAGFGLRAAGTPGLHRSADGGTTWTPLAGVPAEADGLCLLSTADGLLVGTSRGAFRSADGGQTWTPSSSGSAGVRGVASFLSDGRDLYVGLTDNGGGGRGLWRTGDGGVAWTHLVGGLAERAVVTSLLRDGSMLFAAVQSGARGVYRSADGGLSWTPGTGFSPNTLPRVVLAHGGTLFAGAFEALYRSTNDGLSWTADAAFPNVAALVADGGTLYAGSYGDGLFRSLDGGVTWSLVAGTDGWFVNDLIVHAGALYVASQGGGVLRLDGTAWEPLGPSPFVNALLSVGGTLVAATALDAHLYASTDGGATWEPFAAGFSGGEVYELARVGDDLVAGTRGDALWMRPLSDLPMPTVAETPAADRRLALAVRPNPVRAGVTAQVRYTLRPRESVRVEVFDGIGRRIRVLADAPQAVGSHTLALATVGLTPGVYLVRLHTADAVAAVRLTVVP